jgi:hypothetical protein
VERSTDESRGRNGQKPEKLRSSYKNRLLKPENKTDLDSPIAEKDKKRYDQTSSQTQGQTNEKASRSYYGHDIIFEGHRKIHELPGEKNHESAESRGKFYKDASFKGSF